LFGYRFAVKGLLLCSDPVGEVGILLLSFLPHNVSIKLTKVGLLLSVLIPSLQSLDLDSEISA
jgi:hypothetical protein